MELKHVKEMVISVDYNEFEKFVKKHYGGKYEFAPDEECNNDFSRRYVVNENGPDKWQKESLKTYKENGSGSYLAYAFFQDLCHRKLIEPGVYLISVRW
jgi:hypothetical protein